jgi:predicted RNA polymerase sigma factor
MLGKLITDNSAVRNEEGMALLALMCFHSAREESRLTESSEIILSEQQDRTK